jgi:hypothetical protein
MYRCLGSMDSRRHQALSSISPLSEVGHQGISRARSKIDDQVAETNTSSGPYTICTASGSV